MLATEHPLGQRQGGFQGDVRILSSFWPGCCSDFLWQWASVWCQGAVQGVSIGVYANVILHIVAPKLSVCFVWLLLF